MNQTVMLALGNYQFSITSAQYDELTEKHAWRWASYQRVNAKPGLQFQGADSSEISLTGLILAESKNDLDQVEKMKAEGDKGKPLRLISGANDVGRDWGEWCLLELSVKKNYFLAGIAIKQAFTLRLKEYGSS